MLLASLLPCDFRLWPCLSVPLIVDLFDHGVGLSVVLNCLVWSINKTNYPTRKENTALMFSHISVYTNSYKARSRRHVQVVLWPPE